MYLLLLVLLLSLINISPALSRRRSTSTKRDQRSSKEDIQEKKVLEALNILLSETDKNRPQQTRTRKGRQLGAGSLDGFQQDEVCEQTGFETRKREECNEKFETECMPIQLTKFRMEIVSKCKTKHDQSCNITMREVPRQECTPTMEKRCETEYRVVENKVYNEECKVDVQHICEEHIKVPVQVPYHIKPDYHQPKKNYSIPEPYQPNKQPYHAPTNLNPYHTSAVKEHHHHESKNAYQTKLKVNPYHIPKTSNTYDIPHKSDPYHSSPKAEPYHIHSPSDPYNIHTKEDPYPQTYKSDPYHLAPKADPYNTYFSYPYTPMAHSNKRHKRDNNFDGILGQAFTPLDFVYDHEDGDKKLTEIVRQIMLEVIEKDQSLGEVNATITNPEESDLHFHLPLSMPSITSKREFESESEEPPVVSTHELPAPYGCRSIATKICFKVPMVVPKKVPYEKCKEVPTVDCAIVLKKVPELECVPEVFEECSDVAQSVPYLVPDEECEEVAYMECVEIEEKIPVELCKRKRLDEETIFLTKGPVFRKEGTRRRNPVRG